MPDFSAFPEVFVSYAEAAGIRLILPTPEILANAER